MNACQIKRQPANEMRTEDFLQKMAERRHHLLGMKLELMEADWAEKEVALFKSDGDTDEVRLEFCYSFFFELSV
jgi:hypothetical protein